MLGRTGRKAFQAEGQGSAVPRSSTGSLRQEPRRVVANKAGQQGQAAEQGSRRALGPSRKMHQTLC